MYMDKSVGHITKTKSDGQPQTFNNHPVKPNVKVNNQRCPLAAIFTWIPVSGNESGNPIMFTKLVANYSQGPRVLHQCIFFC